MVTFHHRIKTHGDWETRQPFPGVYLWRDPYGPIYLVDHTGTRRVPTSRPPTQSRARAPVGGILKPNPFDLVYAPAG